MDTCLNLHRMWGGHILIVLLVFEQSLGKAFLGWAEKSPRTSMPLVGLQAASPATHHPVSLPHEQSRQGPCEPRVSTSLDEIKWASQSRPFGQSGLTRLHILSLALCAFLNPLDLSI